MDNKKKNEIRIFDDRQVRAVWDAEAEKWWFSVTDIVGILTEQETEDGGRNYWKVLKGRLKDESSQLVTNCNQLKMQAQDGKMRATDALDTEGILRLIQSIPSKKAEPFKMWLAKVGNERINQSVDPELSIDQAVADYRALGYSESWINQRLKSIEARKALTDEWDKSSVERGQEYAILTDLMARTWSGMTTKQYKEYKGLKKENLRDHMTNTELVLNMLAEVSATDISLVKQPQGFDEAAEVAIEGANVAKVARKQLEKSTGKKVVSKLNAKDLKALQAAKEQWLESSQDDSEGDE